MKLVSHNDSNLDGAVRIEELNPLQNLNKKASAQQVDAFLIESLSTLDE